MRKATLIASILVLGFATATASAARCKHRVDRSAEIEPDGITTVEIYALAGDLRVRGVEARSRELQAQVAHRTRELEALNAVTSVISRSLDLQEILDELPQDKSGKRKAFKFPAGLDLKLESALSPDTPFIVVSGNTSEEARQGALRRALGVRPPLS